MNCKFCSKKLRKDNKIGACRAHRNLSPARKEYMSKYAAENFDSIKSFKKKWSDENKTRRNAASNARRSVDVDFKLRQTLRTRLNRALKMNWKSGSSVKDLGCSIQELKAHLESLFSEGMTWLNHSRDGWHIDHIQPLSKFDLTDRSQFKEACNYMNLQPLWAADNIRKRDRI